MWRAKRCGLGLLHRIGHAGAKEAAAKTRLEGHAAQAFFDFRRLWVFSESAFGFARENRRRELPQKIVPRVRDPVGLFPRLVAGLRGKASIGAAWDL